MRRLTIGVAAVALLLTVSTVGQAASGPRLNGSFRITGAIVNNDIGIPAGTVTADVYTFKSTCGGSASCAKVGLTRKSGGRNLKSTLKRTAPGVYQGTEGPSRYVCVKPLGAPGTYTGDIKITATKPRNGLATKLSGKLVIHLVGCTETIEELALKGSLTR